jgi:hypothetical protein
VLSLKLLAWQVSSYNALKKMFKEIKNMNFSPDSSGNPVIAIEK